MGTFVAQTGHTKIVEKLTVKNNKLYWDHKLIKTGTLSGWPKFFVGLSTVTAILVGIVQINQEICFIDSRSCINSKQPIESMQHLLALRRGHPQLSFQIDLKLLKIYPKNSWRIKTTPKK